MGLEGLGQLSFECVRDTPGFGAQPGRVFKRSKSIVQSVVRCEKNVAQSNFLSVWMIIMVWFIQFNCQSFTVKVFAHMN